jgi:hypothetical protein
MLHLPDGTILNINGAKRGMAGWDLGREPNLEAELLISSPSSGNNGTGGGLTYQWRRLNSTTIPRMYHSSAILLPDGRVLISGSAPNSPTDTFYPAMYKTEYRVEYFLPPYLTTTSPRPVFDASSHERIGYNEVMTVHVKAEPLDCPLEFALLQSGFRTHSIGHGQRHIWLVKRSLMDLNPSSSSSNGTSSSSTYKLGDYALRSPPTPEIAPPGFYMLFALCNGVPSEATWLQIGGDPANLAGYYSRGSKPAF